MNFLIGEPSCRCNCMGANMQTPDNPKKERMKTSLVNYILLAAACPFTLNSAELELVVGTYREGSNITEPRPAESHYFQTKLGAFQLIQGFAGYKWLIEVIKHPEKRIYTRSVIENPQDPKKPFVYEGYIDRTLRARRSRTAPRWG
ncbi:hypothetical protein [Opitutus sp. GAS368]|uniref:hypothetical protein n=1 Tax=Opitutus sp. GAS368 TaxID=1882749 RepID=UPI0012FD418C|nr:hypothetical protein [Opitutus sp. GAS368]